MLWTQFFLELRPEVKVTLILEQYGTLRNTPMYPVTNQIWNSYLKYQGHNDPKTMCDIPQPQDVSKHLIWSPVSNNIGDMLWIVPVYFRTEARDQS